jgi:hypothetical protein
MAPISVKPEQFNKVVKLSRTKNKHSKHMPVKTAKIEFAVGDEVIMDLDGTDTPAKVVKFKGNNIIVEDSDGSEYECEPHELTKKPAKKSSKVVEEPEEEEEEPKPAKKSKKTEEPEEAEEEPEEKPAAKKGKGWNATKPAAKKDFGFPVGNWEALAFDGGTTEKGKAVSAFIDLVGVNDEAVTGIQQRKNYTLKDDKGSWNDDGIGFFKADLIDLGFTEDQIDAVDQDELAESVAKLLKKLRKMEPWVSVRAKKKGDYINVFIQGLMDNQEDKPENPLAGKF